MTRTSRTAVEVPAIARIDAALASERFVERIPLEHARDCLYISQGVAEDGREIVACAECSDIRLLSHNLSVRLEREIVVMLADAELIASALESLATARAEREEQADAGYDEVGDIDFDEILASDERDLLQTAGRAPVVKLVNALLFDALRLRASDVHVQPTVDGVAVRYRIDGSLLESRRLPAKLLAPVVSRVKVMARMDIAERRLPQDGRAMVTIGSEEVDLRVSSLPTSLGERLVIRLLDKRRGEMFDLERLGMPAAVRATFEGLCQRPYGMVLVTGPTGSGKTTTLYSALRLLNAPDRNILTLEDPIEYELDGISQSQINTRKGVTFATGLRHILRQDPDVIMVGEIRDAETARIAIQSALTGHLVFSTLHTNSAASAVTRLVDLGIEPYLITSSVSAVLAQRLVRTLCGMCDGVASEQRCESCMGSGYSGRRGLYELLVMNDEIRRLVREGSGDGAIELAAIADGMTTLRSAGLDAVSQGRTTIEEVDRVTLTGFSDGGEG